MRRRLFRLSLPFREPFVTAAGVFPSRDLVLLQLEGDDGAVGFGEAAPFEPYDGIPLEAVVDALRNGRNGGPPQARAAEEMALLDLEARRDGRAIGQPGADAIAVNRTLGGGPPDEVARRAADGVREGFSCFKVKVGLPDDEERVAAVRQAIGPWPALRVDANGAWSAEEAVDAIGRLSAHDLQLVEQPCRSLEDLAAVRAAVTVPVAADEPVASADDVRAAATAGACDIVNVKLAASGGFEAARAAIAAAREHGLEPYLSSTLDGPWGIAAALQLAASERLSLACGLATLELFDAALARAIPPPRAGLLAVPQGPGLGVAIDRDSLAEVLVEELD
ncbi:MAG: mandelate racemase/muconate lactonizing enzyme family protein [Actinobacteria bacterium]|nr:mandelate racemase/muconate lactonizing enzyme family protein [Actinomycetota bacterium]